MEWEKSVIENLVFAAVTEQRRTRRWGIFFKFLIFIYLFALLIIMTIDFRGTKLVTEDHTALVDIAGVIAADQDASADHVVTSLRKAFKNKHSKAIILRINSPGGSPVQSGYIHDEILRLREKYPDKKVYSVISDVCASGGYFIAVAAHKIYANKASMVGSIGVIMNSFGFTDVMQKIGIERRLLTSGEHKGFLDPFSPLKQTEVDHMGTVLNNVHQQFINIVKTGRGARLKDNDKLFSGYIWSGEQSLDIGLIDGFGSASYVAREIIKIEKLVDYSFERNIIEKISKQLGLSFSKEFSNQLHNLNHATSSIGF